MTRVLAALLILTAAITAQVPVSVLPQAYIDTAYHSPTYGLTLKAHSSTELKNALNSANPGDTIVLDAGVAYQGNFTLPVKSNPNNKWIYIVGSALSSLNAPGTRVNPATDAAKMPKIVTPGVAAALTLPPGANHYRLVGLEIYSSSTQGCVPSNTPSQNCYSQSLVNGASLPGKPLVDSITVGRCYIHGSATQDVRVGVVANGSNFSVIDSYVSDIHQSTNDSQAVLAYYSPGPIKIVNNYLESTSENIMFGGAGGASNPFVASDIEIRNNYLFKPLSWAAAGVTIPPHNRWAVKNLLELKSAKRVLIDSNVLENVWVSAQTGFAIVLTPRTSDSGNLAVVDDVTISNNVLKNVSSGFNVAEFDNLCDPNKGCTSQGESKRIVFYNNLFLLGDTTQAGYTTGYDGGGMINREVTDFVVQHNTVIAPPNLDGCKISINFNVSAPFNPPVSRTHNVWILDNTFCKQVKGPAGMVGQFPYVLDAYMGDPTPVNPRLSGNVFYAPPGDRVYPLPPQNFASDKRLTNSKDSEYHLKYPAKMQTSDGQVPGVDNSKLASAYAAESGITRSEAPSGPQETKQ